jgi:phosphate transport system substrate-binding protein
MTTRPILAILLNAILPTCVMAADLAVAGSSTIYPVIAEAATVYDGAKLVVTQGGSGDGIKKAADGTVAVGMASRDLKEAEKALGLGVLRIGNDGIALVVHGQNAAAGLTKTQAGGIFAGSQTTWKDIGGDGDITLVSLHEKHGTTDGFAHFLGLEVSSDPATKAVVFTPKGGKPSGVTAQRSETVADCLGLVAKNPRAITFAPIGSTLRLISQGAPLKFLSLEGITPSLAVVKEQRWPFTRPLNLVYKAPASPAVQSFLDFMTSADGQALVQKYDYVPLE